MRTARRIGLIGGTVLAATGLVTGSAFAMDRQQPEPAVFVQSDNTTANTVVAYDRAADGTLTQAGVYATGGRGGVLGGSVVDHLASQGSLVLDRAHALLYAVNAGSDTLTMFNVESDHLRLAQVVSSGGTFPASVTTYGNAVYVLNARDGGSVQGYQRIGNRLALVPAWHRALGLDPGQTPEFTSTPGQVAFTPDGGKLVVTTKGNGNHIDVFGVDPRGGISARPVVTDDASTPFAVTFDPNGHLVVAESGANSIATYDIHGNGTLGLISRQDTGQAGTCWVTAVGTRLYTSNAGSDDLSGFGAGGDGSLRTLGTTGTDAGPVDSTATSDDRFLYAATGAAGIVDEFAVRENGSLHEVGSVAVPGDVGGEGIAAS